MNAAERVRRLDDSPYTASARTVAGQAGRHVDVADETSKLARNQVLSRAGVSVLAQANQLPQLALNLL